jgi:hypothetical protein
MIYTPRNHQPLIIGATVRDISDHRSHFKP